MGLLPHIKNYVQLKGPANYDEAYGYARAASGITAPVLPEAGDSQLFTAILAIKEDLHSLHTQISADKPTQRSACVATMERGQTPPKQVRFRRETPSPQPQQQQQKQPQIISARRGILLPPSYVRHLVRPRQYGEGSWGHDNARVLITACAVWLESVILYE
jgi:DNA segregation ATPase FtsK/SpoIIIE-like protein